MVYALNVFNIKEGREDEYREFSVRAGKIIYGMGGKVVSSGWNPIRQIHGDQERRHLIVVDFPSEKVFQDFLDQAEKDDIHKLRENSTSEYIWTLYKTWDIREWVKAKD